jgi:hypothetical protein
LWWWSDLIHLSEQHPPSGFCRRAHPICGASEMVCGLVLVVIIKHEEVGGDGFGTLLRRGEKWVSG